VAGTTPSIVTQEYVVYKPNVIQNPTTVLSKLGNLQKAVLLIIKRTFNNSEFTISDVRVTLREEYNINVDRRNLWHVFQRLVRRGIIKKVMRGLYRLVKDIDESVLKFRELNDNLYRDGYRDGCYGVVRGGCCGVYEGRYLGGCQGVYQVRFNDLYRGVCGGGFGGVVRVHGFGGFGGGLDGFLGFVVRVGFWYDVLGFYYMGLLDMLRSYYGLPKYFIRRFKRWVSSLASKVVTGETVVGGHGFYGKKVRGYKKFNNIVPLACLDGGHVYELGVDTYIPKEVAEELIKALRGSGFIKCYVRLL
jgi:hypothetical protein